MKLSKKEEAAILHVYKTYFDSYIEGDVETIAELLKDDYTQIGSAEVEVFFDKKEAKKFLTILLTRSLERLKYATGC